MIPTFTPMEWERIVHLAQIARQRTRIMGTPGALTTAANRAGNLLRLIAVNSMDRKQ